MEKTNRKNRWMLLLLTAVMLPLQALAENSTNSTLAIEQFSINAGETKQMLIDLNNPSQEVTMVEFYMYLPTGLSVAEEDGDLAVDIAGRTTWKKHSLEASQTSSGAIHVMLYSGSNTIISGTSGALLSITLTAASTFNGGDIQLKQQLMTSPDEAKTESKPADYTYTISGSDIPFNDGDTFTASNSEGVEMTFKVISAADKTCEVVRQGKDRITIVSTPVPESIIIPAEVNGFKVVSIGYQAFYGSKKIKSVVIPEGVTSIDTHAFRECYNLASFTFPKSLKVCGYASFEECAYNATVHISDLKSWCNVDLTNWDLYGWHLFLNGDEVQDLVIPDGVTSIGESQESVSPFSNCASLTSVTIPSSVTTMYAPFSGCSNLTSVTVLAEMPVAINTEIPNATAAIANATLYVPKGCKAAYEAADYWKDFKEIIEYLKDGDTFTAETEGGNVMTFEVLSAANKTCEVVRKGYESNTFVTLASKDVVIPSKVNGFKVVSIGYEALIAKLTSLTIPESLTSIKAGAFENYDRKAKIGEIRITDLTAFCNIKLSDPFPSGFRLYLNGEEVTMLTIPEGISSVGEDTWDYNSPFSGCISLTSAEIPNSVTSLGYGAFWNCTNLTSVSIPATLTSIGYGAFDGCTNVTSFTSYVEQPSDIQELFCDFGEFCANATLYVPKGSKTAYEAADGWKDFKEIVEMEDENPDDIITFADANVKDICVANWDTNSDGELSKGEAAAVTSLGNAFKSSSEITSFNELQYFTGLTEIGENAFNGSSLVSVSLPNSLNTIGVQAFYNCNKLEDVTLPEGLNSIGYSAFEGCSSLKEVTLPSTLTEIGASAFYDCHGLIAVFSNIVEPFSIARTVFEQTIEWDDYTNDHFMPSSATLYVPYGKKEIYKSVAGLGFNTNGWTRFANMEEMDEDFPNGIINFADANVKTICVAKWDKNGDGELSKGEAAAVTSLDDAFKNNEEITSFDELEHFLLVTKLDIGAFRNCTHLTSLKLPKGLKEICANAFTNCQSLESLHIPASLRTISEESVFHYCLSLTGFTVDESNYTFSAEDGILYKWSKTVLVCCPATKTGTLTLPSTVETIMTSAFAMCTKLTTLKLPASLTKIGDAAFVGCSGLTYFDFAADGQLSEIGIGCFNGCSKLYAFRVGTGWNGKLAQNYEVYDRVLYDIKSGSRKLVAYPNKRNNFYTLPEGVTDILDYAFCMTEIKNVTLPASLKTIHPYAFAYCEQLTKVTSLAWQPCDVTNVFTGTTVSNATLSVRKGTKTAYENTDGWDGFKTTEEFISYDVNEDGYTNMKDVETIADYIMGKAPDGFIWQKVDTNGDDYVNAADIVKLVKNIPVIDPEAGIDDPCPDCGVDDDF